MTEKLKIIMINNAEDLDTACQKWAHLSRIAIDTEFERSRTFFPKLGLIQVYDGELCYLIDPLEINDISPICGLFESKTLTKVLHSGSEDLEILGALCHAPLERFFDTQVAANIAGFDFALSYQRLTAQICGIELSKAETRSDWMKRPLTDSQIQYAALDVRYLFELHDELLDTLSNLNRLSWLEQDCQRLVNDSTQPISLSEQFRRFKSGWKLDPVGRSVLLAALEWREQQARRKDLPRSWVIKDQDLFQLSFYRPVTEEQLKTKLKLPVKTLKRYESVFLNMVKTARDKKPEQHPPALPKPLDPNLKALLKTLREMINEHAEELQVAPELIGGKREMMGIIHPHQLPPKMAGWRRDIIGNDLLDVVKQQTPESQTQLASH